MFPIQRIYIFTLTVTLVSSQLFHLDKDGNVGVNFFGFRAAAGLGGLLSGDASKGGLHASAGTPFGQSAAAGLGGSTSGDKSSGLLYAGATAGNGVSAVAGLDGETGKDGGVGHAVAGASAGGLFSGVEKTAAHGSNHEIEEYSNVIPKQGVVERYPIKLVEKSYAAPPPLVITKDVSNTGPTQGGFLSRLFADINTRSVLPPADNVVAVNYPVKPATLTTTASVNSNLFNDIFNIPISTLTAVNKLVSNIIGGTSGSVSVTKSAHVR